MMSRLFLPVLASAVSLAVAPAMAQSQSGFDLAGLIEGTVGGQNHDLEEEYFFLDDPEPVFGVDIDGFQGQLGGGVQFSLAPSTQARVAGYFESNNGETQVYEDEFEVEHIEFKDGYGARASIVFFPFDADTQIAPFGGVGMVEFCKRKAFDYGAGPDLIESCHDVNFLECGVELGREFLNDQFDGFVRLGFRDYDDFETTFEPDFPERHEFSGNSTYLQVGGRVKFGQTM